MNRSALISGRGDEAKDYISEEEKQDWKLYERLEYKYSKKKIEFMWRVQERYYAAQDGGDGDFFPLYKILRSEVSRSANYWASRSGYAVEREDFESAFYEKCSDW